MIETSPADAGAIGQQAESAISTDQLTKRYGTFTAVDSLTIAIERGEIFGFLGPNGAGKTTTMRMLLGLVRPTSGSAEMLGLDISTQTSAILAKTGSIIENPTFYPFLSGLDNMRIVASLTGTPDSRITEVLEVVDLTADADRKFKKYSLGMKQRLAVAASLLADPSILILDEPANGLDPAGIVEMRNLMKRLKSQGKTVFISSHVLHEIEQMCDRIAILNHGKVVVQGRVEDLLRGGDQIEVQVDEVEKAATLLKSLPWVTKVSESDGVLTVTADGGQPAALNKALAEAGIYASGLRRKEESLEQYFLDVTSGPHG